MLHRIFKDSIIYGITGMLTRGIPLIMVPFYTRILSPEDYGVIDILTILGALVNFTVALEISQGVARHYADTESINEKVIYASSALWFVIVAYGIFVCITVQFSGPLSLFILGGPRWSSILKFAVVAMGANGIYFLLQDLLRWQLKPKFYGISSLVYTTFTTGTAAYLILISRIGITGIYIGQIIGAIIGSFAAWYFSRELYSFSFNLKKCKQMLSFSLPLVPSSIAVFLSFYIDRICIKHYMTLTDVGIYGIGFRFASIISLLVIGVRGSLTPLIYQSYKDPETPEKIAKLFRFFLLCALPLYVFLSICSREILYFLTVPAFYAGWSVMPLLGLSILLSEIYIFAPGLGIAKKTRKIALLNIVASILNAALNVMLIPFVGIIGAALATCTAAFFSFGARMRFSQNLYRLPYNWKRIILALAVSLSAVTIGLIVGFENMAFSIQNLVLKFCIIIIAVLFIGLTLLRREDLELLTKKIGWKLA
jgi:O-antigen/teichoic acid export membrane protein